jgi:NADH:ubiquinone oxidoreductase subunit F (NADH-binding)
LIGRFGAEWFRALGTSAMPGSTLISLSGAVHHPTVLEVPLGTSLRSILAAGGADPNPQAVLVGGYGGTWLSGAHLDVAFANETLAPLGATVGAGILVVIPRNACGLVETQRIATWMANESARQCGPCAFGLPALADDLALLASGSRDPQATYQRLIERCGVIEGRGACRHPDGVTRLVKSALEVFATDIHDHMRARPCAWARSNEHYVPMTVMEREEDMVWE